MRAATTTWKRDISLWVEFIMMTMVAIPLAQWAPVNKAIHEYLAGRRGDVYPAIVGLEGTILGFVMASLTIVIGYASAPRFEILRGTRHWAAIFRSYTIASKWTAVALIYGLVALFADTDDAPNSPLALMLMLSALLAAVRLARVLYITEKVVKVVVNAHPRRPGE
ncbi:hypothetical protein AB0C12_24935 [Actinoplanes sp. NPDC048967]|uniref:hypothetical protein n=1 Tax=Actinoplanes sp. NPDC048967 TaxID=3155269 RepID=UPI0033DF5E5D